MPWQWKSAAQAKEEETKKKKADAAAGEKKAAAVPGDQWQCAWCNHKNPSGKSKCAACGLRRNAPRTGQSAAAPKAGAASAPPPATAPPPSGNTVRDHLALVGASLAAAGVQTNPPIPAKPAATAPDKAAAAAKTRVDDLEKLLAAIPVGPDFDDVRVATSAKLETAKAALLHCKPLAVRVAAAKQQFERCTQREAEARTLADQAIAVHEESERALTKAQEEVTALEAELGATAAEPTCPTTALASLSQAAEAMLSMLGQQDGVHTEHQAQARAHMDQMLIGFRTSLDAANKVAAAKAAVAPPTVVHPTGNCRWRSKAPPAPARQDPEFPPPSRMVRHTGKQPPRRPLITDFFAPALKRLHVGESRTAAASPAAAPAPPAAPTSAAVSSASPAPSPSLTAAELGLGEEPSYGPARTKAAPVAPYQA